MRATEHGARDKASVYLVLLSVSVCRTFFVRVFRDLFCFVLLLFLSTRVEEATAQDFSRAGHEGTRQSRKQTRVRVNNTIFFEK